MRLTNTLLLLPAVALAQQVPLRENLEAWYNKAKSYIPSAATAPIDAGAAHVAARHVTELTTANWQQTLKLTPGATEPENWMVLVTGGNQTCEGKCEGVNAAWNKTAALFSADSKAPHMGLIDCDSQRVLCSTWFAGPPSLWYIQLPVAALDQSTMDTTVYVKHLNLTTTTAAEIAGFHKKKEYLTMEPIESFFHPFNGQLAKYGLNVPIGYAIFLFGMIPSWSFMLIVSFFTRSMMSKRVGNADTNRARRVNPGSVPLGGAPPANEI